MIREFRQFLLRGNVVDLAVAVVIGAAFGDVVKAMVEHLMTPLIAAMGGTPDFSALKSTINSSAILYGAFLNAVISFVVIAAIVFFLIVKPMNLLIERSHREPTADPTTKLCPECLSEIPIAATRCAFCTSTLAA